MLLLAACGGNGGGSDPGSDLDTIVKAALDAVDKIAVRGKLTEADTAVVVGSVAGDRILNGALMGQIQSIVGPKVWSLFAQYCVIGDPLTASQALATSLTNDGAGDIAFKSACADIIRAATHPPTPAP